MDPKIPSSVRVAFVVEGSRGDIQPPIACALSLKAKGYVVKVFTNVDHISFCESFGLDCAGVLYNCKELLGRPDVKAAMASGNAMKAGEVIEKMKAEAMPNDLPKCQDSIKEFQATVLMFGADSYFRAMCYSLVHTVPAISVQLQVMLPCTDTAPFGLPTLPCGMNKLWFKLLDGEFEKGLKQFKEQAKSSLDVDLDGKLEKVYMDMGFKDVPSLPCPMFYGFSTAVIPRHREWPTENMNICGFFTMDKVKQEEMMLDKDKGALFGADSNQALKDFLAAGAPPVYMGWGSMICKSAEWMAQIAVEALKHAGARGVILGGWAELGLSAVPPALQDFCKENVLFVPSAPHEWLFPQCAVLVHHGGSGTTAASVRSGRPTIITPMLMDQFDFAKGINRVGCGVGLKTFKSLNAKKLGDAVKRCLTDEKIKAAAKKAGDQLQAEDGTKALVEGFEKWLADEFVSGNWLKKHNAVMDLCKQAADARRKKSGGSKKQVAPEG